VVKKPEPEPVINSGEQEEAKTTEEKELAGQDATAMEGDENLEQVRGVTRSQHFRETRSFTIKLYVFDSYKFFS
jgi:hypothetical protein